MGVAVGTEVGVAVRTDAGVARGRHRQIRYASVGRSGVFAGSEEYLNRVSLFRVLCV